MGKEKSPKSPKSPKNEKKEKKEKKSKDKKKEKDISPKSENLKFNYTDPLYSCDGCSLMNSKPLNYCLNCNQILCNNCDENRHKNLKDSLHKRIKINNNNDVNNYRIKCNIHPYQYAQYYCRGCWQPLCNECRILHNIPGHEAILISDAYFSSITALQNSCTPDLTRKQQLLRQQIGNIQTRCREVKAMSASIQAETKADYDSIITRLVHEENIKLSFLQASINELQCNIDEIDYFIKSNNLVNFYTPNFNTNVENTPKQMLDFLKDYAKVIQTADQLVKKPFDSNINVNATFDREIETRRQKLLHIDELEKQILLKDQMIYKLVNERKENSQKVINEELKELTKKSENEIKEWSEISSRLNNQLEKYKMKCKWCNIKLKPENINSTCKNNKEGKHYFENYK